MTAYHWSGAVNAVLFVLGLGGFVSQLLTIRARRLEAQRPTAVLSLNYFAVSFLAYFAFFVYGFSITPFNHYLVWPRLLGCGLVWAVLFEIARDRRGPLSLATPVIGALLLASGVGLLVSGASVGALATLGPQLMAIVATVFVSQSMIHQIVLLRRAGHPGAVSWSLHFLTLLKDGSTVAFGVAMGAALGWPLVLMGGTSAGLKLVILWHLRRA